MSSLAITSLGQAGFRLDFGGIVLYVDPYLSDQLERVEGSRLKRLRPAPFSPQEVRDARYVLISHIHMDHCDIETLLPLAAASPDCRFLGPRVVVDYLRKQGIDQTRLIIANRDPINIEKDLLVTPIPAAHKLVEEDFDGFLRYLGYVIDWRGKRLFHTGDTCVHGALIERVRACGPIDVALLPVNECNYFRDKAGIVGNMSIREAFRLAEEINACTVVPMHYDMFEPNQAYREEIEIVYQKTAPRFRLELDPENL
jgi:L-ascorbate 6-phosphate lactonase